VTDRGSFPVDAQWALQGKTLGRDGYRVLACSTGSRDALSLENFTEAIGRFSMGTPETLPNALPQVTISYLQPGPVNHLALAIHRFASDAHLDGQLAASDDDGRPVVATSYYCVRYDPVAARSVSYRDMYEAFARAPLRPVNGSMLSVEMPAAPAAPDPDAISPLAAQAAALLLTCRPVCVLGATLQTSMIDRLDFIDTVMSLLPYGFRARMTAATWTRATNQNHRFRLFFSSARRDTKIPDNVVVWGHPEQTTINRDDDDAKWYFFEWLDTGQVTQQQLSLVAGITKPRSLTNPGEVLEALDDVFRLSGHRRRPRPTLRTETPYPGQKGSENGPGPTGDTTAAARSELEQLLIDCARSIEVLDTRQLSAAIGRLRIPARRGVEAGERDRCRELIREHRLFRHNDALGKDEDTLREILLKIAFEPPLSYEDYCLIEEATGEPEVPDPSLLQLIDKQGADDRVKAITYRQLPSVDAGKKLSKWYESRELSADRLLNLLALEVKRPRHMRLLCDVTTDYLRKKSKTLDPKNIDDVLRRHSYLAGKLQDSLAPDDQYQLVTLGTFLGAAYPYGLTRKDLYHVMIGTRESITLPFLGAVLLMVKNYDDACLARELYVYYSFFLMDFEMSTRRELLKLVAIPERPAFNPQAALDPEGAPSPHVESLSFERKVSAPMSPHDDLAGDPARYLTTGVPGSTTDGQPDGASLSRPEDDGQQPDSGEHRAGEPRMSNDGQ
jgi:hypothetical protein